eukprot:CAMPEP_0197176514 /NCGR_PEP_ID=MMETSP1423-20130617/2412_1 /TAXON_ID=476441 /ORGANISM="Pseudo-nitzschia heimii, Strain UNC1101" /LENGTH=258 /DNA_ID=CAMNT_0042625895 /DNA_START=137 /DNA_END=909 /DNA_ORIENTATION=-
MKRSNATAIVVIAMAAITIPMAVEGRHKTNDDRYRYVEQLRAGRKNRRALKSYKATKYQYYYYGKKHQQYYYGIGNTNPNPNGALDSGTKHQDHIGIDNPDSNSVLYFGINQQNYYNDGIDTGSSALYFPKSGKRGNIFIGNPTAATVPPSAPNMPFDPSFPFAPDPGFPSYPTGSSALDAYFFPNEAGRPIVPTTTTKATKFAKEPKTSKGFYYNQPPPPLLPNGAIAIAPPGPAMTLNGITQQQQQQQQQQNDATT